MNKVSQGYALGAASEMITIFVSVTSNPHFIDTFEMTTFKNSLRE